MRISKELKKRGWTFVGPTTVYAFMQAMGLVNDHIEGCFCRAEIEKERSKFKRPNCRSPLPASRISYAPAPERNRPTITATTVASTG